MQDEPLSDQCNSPFSGQIQFVPWKNNVPTLIFTYFLYVNVYLQVYCCK